MDFRMSATGRIDPFPKPSPNGGNLRAADGRSRRQAVLADRAVNVAVGGKPPAVLVGVMDGGEGV